MLAVADGRPELLEPLVPGLPYLGAEAIYAVRAEMACTVADVLDRRTRASLRNARAAAAAAPAGRRPRRVRARVGSHPHLDGVLVLRGGLDAGPSGRPRRIGTPSGRGDRARIGPRVTRPSPVASVDAGDRAVLDRLKGRKVVVDEALRRRLAEVCAAVSSDEDERADAARDWWPLAISWAIAGQVPSRPAVVARPTDTAQVAAVLALCDAARVPVTAAGGRSGVCGGSVPLFGGVALDLCGLTGLTTSTANRSSPTCGRGPSAPKWRRDFGVTPGSRSATGLSRWTSRRSAGGSPAGVPANTPTGTGRSRTWCSASRSSSPTAGWCEPVGRGPRAATGPDLTQLFVGSEGTLGVITEGRFRVHPVPEAEGRRAFGFDSFAEGLDTCRRLLRRGCSPAVLRLYDATESARSFDQPDTNVLVVLDEADPALLDATLAVVDDECRDASTLDVGLVARWLEHRNDVSALAPLWRSGIVVDTAEVSARWSALPDLYRAVLDALGQVEGTLVASSHQSHAYTDGACLYFTFAGRPGDEWPDPGAAAAAYYRRAWDVITKVTLAAGGAISHHHGIGLNRGRYLADALGEGFGVLTSLKQALDPHGVLNPENSGSRAPSAPSPGRERPRRRRRHVRGARRGRAPGRDRRAHPPPTGPSRNSLPRLGRVRPGRDGGGGSRRVRAVPRRRRAGRRGGDRQPAGASTVLWDRESGTPLGPDSAGKISAPSVRASRCRHRASGSRRTRRRPRSRPCSTSPIRIGRGPRRAASPSARSTPGSCGRSRTGSST